MRRSQRQLATIVRRRGVGQYSLLAVVVALSATLIVGHPGVMAAPAEQAGATPIGPVTRYSLTIDGFELASFTELESIHAEIAPPNFYETSGDQIRFQNLPGKMQPPTITLRRPPTTSLELWSWHEAVRQGNMAAARRSFSLTMFNGQNRPVMKFWLEKGWPAQISVGVAKDGKSDVLTETVTFVCDYIQRVAP